MRIAIERADGGVSIMHIPEGADPAAEVEKWQTTMLPGEAAVGWHEISDNDIPTDRTFRSAWKISDKAIAVDMDKARDIQMDRIRSARDAELAALDLPSLRAIEAGDDAKSAEIASQKQALRDLPQTLDLTKATTPEELAAIWPEALTA